MQYVLFNALEVKYDNIMIFLRNIAKCWIEDKQQSQRVLDCINTFKGLVQNYSTFHVIWQHLAQIEEKALTKIQLNFMEMLCRNGMSSENNL